MLSFTPFNTLTRNVGEKRKYDTTRVRKEKAPSRPRVVQSVEDIEQGTCFAGKTKHTVPEGEIQRCCKRQCNVVFGEEEGSIARIRSSVPPPGTGQQGARKTYIRGCISGGKNLVLSDSHVGLSAVVCQLFFVAVTGLSKNAISSAMKPGGTGM